MKRRLLFVNSAMVALLGVNAAFMAVQSEPALPGYVTDWNELSQIQGESIAGTDCQVQANNPCNAGVALAGGCVLDPTTQNNCTIATNNVICNVCIGRSEICVQGTLKCVMTAGGAACCTPNTCTFVPAVRPAIIGSCTCTGAGVAAGFRTDC